MFDASWQCLVCPNISLFFLIPFFQIRKDISNLGACSYMHWDQCADGGGESANCGAQLGNFTGTSDVLHDGEKTQV